MVRKRKAEKIEASADFRGEKETKLRKITSELCGYYQIMKKNPSTSQEYRRAREKYIRLVVRMPEGPSRDKLVEMAERLDNTFHPQTRERIATAEATGEKRRYHKDRRSSGRMAEINHTARLPYTGGQRLT